MKVTRKRKKLSSRKIGTQLGLTAAAIAGSAFVGDMASASVVTSFDSVNLSVPATLAGVYINLVTGATGSSGGAVAGWDFNPYQTAIGLGFYWSPDTVGGLQGGGVAVVNTYSDLPLGTVVGSGSTFSSNIQGTNPNFRTTGLHYLGFRFSNAGVLNYGFAAINTTAGSGSGNGFPATLIGWQFENTGAPITISAIPEPGSAGLLAALALGASTIRVLRRRVA